MKVKFTVTPEDVARHLQDQAHCPVGTWDSLSDRHKTEWIVLLRPIMDHLAERAQVTYELGDVIMVDPKGHQSVMLHYSGDSIIVTDNEPCITLIGKTLTSEDFNEMDGIEIKTSAQSGPIERTIYLNDQWHEVYIAAIHAGLTVEKAALKACGAIEHMGEIEEARDKAVAARISEEFGLDEG